MKAEKKPFWEVKTLEQMTVSEWEALCDGCALCCLHKFEDEDTAEVFYTNVSCKLLDTETCRCKSYTNRFELVTDCLKIKPENFDRMHLLPNSCAYRRLWEGDVLNDWHPLVSRDSETVHQTGISARDKVIPEDNVHPDDLSNFIFFKVD
jgi:uncharacterized protein